MATDSTEVMTLSNKHRTFTDLAYCHSTVNAWPTHKHSAPAVCESRANLLRRPCVIPADSAEWTRRGAGLSFRTGLSRHGTGLRRWLSDQSSGGRDAGAVALLSARLDCDVRILQSGEEGAHQVGQQPLLQGETSVCRSTSIPR